MRTDDAEPVFFLQIGSDSPKQPVITLQHPPRHARHDLATELVGNDAGKARATEGTDKHHILVTLFLQQTDELPHCTDTNPGMSKAFDFLFCGDLNDVNEENATGSSCCLGWRDGHLSSSGSDDWFACCWAGARGKRSCRAAGAWHAEGAISFSADEIHDIHHIRII